MLLRTPLIRTVEQEPGHRFEAFGSLKIRDAETTGRSNAASQIILQTTCLRLCSILMVLVAFVALAGGRANAAEEDEAPPVAPLFFFQAAGFNPLYDATKAIFQSADRMDVMKSIDKILEEQEQVAGLDRTKPVGMMLFLGDTIGDSMWPATFLPTQKPMEFLNWLSSHGPGGRGNSSVKVIDETTGRYQLTFGAGDPMEVIRQGNYLILTDTVDHVERRFPDVERLAAQYASRFEISHSVLLKNVPIGLRTIGVEFVKSNMRADLQQRDGEPETSYRLRRMSGENFLQTFEQVAADAQEATIGLKFNKETTSVEIDGELIASPDSKLAKLFNAYPGRHTQFSAVLNRASTLTLALSTFVSPDQQKILMETWKNLEKQLTTETAKSDHPGDMAKITPLLNALRTTTEKGQFEVVIQMLGQKQGDYQVMGGVRLAGNKDLPGAVMSLFETLKERMPGNGAVQTVDLDVARIDDAPVHRVVVPPSSTNRRLYGENGELAFTVTPTGIWFAIAKEKDSVNVLRELLRVASESSDEIKIDRSPVQGSMQMKQWVSLFEGRGERAKAFGEEAAVALANGEDQIRFRIAPTKSSVKLKIEAQKGLILLVARMIARRAVGEEL